MATEDVGMPRIDAAKIAIRDFVAKEPDGMKIGVVAFSGGAFLLTPPTTDREAVLGAINFHIGAALQVSLDSLAPPDVTESGMNLGFGATDPNIPRKALANPDNVSVVLLSDGASTTGPPPLEVAQVLARQGIRIYTVGIGRDEGSFNPNGGRYMRLEEPTLRGIAEVSGGAYFSATDANKLREVYGKISRETQFEFREVEVTVASTAIGVMLLLVAGGLGLRWAARLP
jgi:Ca-activated chloride channel family protein